MLGAFLHDNGPWIVAILALALGVVNFIRQVQSDPKSDIRADLEYDEWPQTFNGPDGPEDYEGVYVTVTNRGAGEAYDVTITVIGNDGRPQVRELGTLATDASGKGNFNRAGGVPVNGTVTIAWRHRGKRSSLLLDY